jgi:hypothetical protein
MRKSYRRSLWALGAVASYALFGFLALPAIVRAVALKQLPELLHRDVQLAELKMNPFDLSIDVLGFAVTERAARPSSFGRAVHQRSGARSDHRHRGFRGDPLGKASRARRPLKQGRLNFADLLQPAGTSPAPQPSAEPTHPPKVRIGVLSIQGGAISFRDETRALPFATEIGPIEIQLSSFSTEPEQNSPYAFEARFDQDSKVAWSGQLSVNPLRSTGTLSLEGIRLAPLRPYLAELSGLVLADGSFAAKGNYRLDASQGALIFTVAEGRSSLSGLRIDSPSGAPRVRLRIAGSLAGSPMTLALSRPRSAGDDQGPRAVDQAPGQREIDPSRRPRRRGPPPSARRRLRPRRAPPLAPHLKPSSGASAWPARSTW